ncbi:MAG: hypothetical protein PUB18_04660 [bacterium]|nr:hypothetical protein [bacterium]
MKRNYRYAFRIIFIFSCILVVYIASNIEMVIYKSNYKVSNTNTNKALESSIVMKLIEHTTSNIVEDEVGEIQEDLVPEKIEEVESMPPVVQEEKIEAPVVHTTPNITYSPIDTTAYPVLQTTFGNLSHYGHDCYGCTSGLTASGYNISNGIIHYSDPTFGNVRIVAAGYEYQEGSILRLTNVESTPIVAIVLDRGGAIGAGKSFTIDLLTESNAKAYELGIRNNVKIEMLRSGY